jgi:hypothetical protein
MRAELKDASFRGKTFKVETSASLNYQQGDRKMTEEKKEEMLPVEAGKAQAGDMIKADFSTLGGYSLMKKQATTLASSQLIPEQFRNKPQDCMIALEMAQRIGASPFAVLQNIYIVHGKPAWSAQFLVSCINACGRFSPLRYRQTGTKGQDDWGVIAWAKDLSDGEVLESPEVTLSIAKAEGWFSKKGSKWQTMPELMLRYRAATFFARTYAPDVTMGMMTNDEAHEVDVSEIEVSGSPIGEDRKPDHAASAEIEEPETTTAADDDLPPVGELPKSACKAAIAQFKDAPFFSEVIDDSVAPGMAWENLPISTLRDVLQELRDKEAAGK